MCARILLVVACAAAVNDATAITTVAAIAITATGCVAAAIAIAHCHWLCYRCYHCHWLAIDQADSRHRSGRPPSVLLS